MKYLSASIAAALLFLTACQDNAKQTSAPTATSQAAPASAPAATAQHNPNWQTYLVGSEISYQPFEFKDENGQPTGFEVELLQAIAQAEQFNVQFIHTPRGEFSETINSGKFAIWASALSVNPDRAQYADFSNPFIEYERVLFMVDKPENNALKTLEDFKGKKISTNRSSKANIELATKLTGEANVVAADSFFLALKEVYAGKADAMLGDNRVFEYYALQNPGVKTRTVSTNEAKKGLVFAVKKGNTELLNKINSGLDKVKKDGSYDKLIEKWFGKTK